MMCAQYSINEPPKLIICMYQWYVLNAVTLYNLPKCSIKYIAWNWIVWFFVPQTELQNSFSLSSKTKVCKYNVKHYAWDLTDEPLHIKKETNEQLNQQFIPEVKPLKNPTPCNCVNQVPTCSQLTRITSPRICFSLQTSENESIKYKKPKA